jgi:hypothetical protein
VLPTRRRLAAFQWEHQPQGIGNHGDGQKAQSAGVPCPSAPVCPPDFVNSHSREPRYACSSDFFRYVVRCRCWGGGFQRTPARVEGWYRTRPESVRSNLSPTPPHTVTRETGQAPAGSLAVRPTGGLPSSRPCPAGVGGWHASAAGSRSTDHLPTTLQKSLQNAPGNQCVRRTTSD